MMIMTKNEKKMYNNEQRRLKRIKHGIEIDKGKLMKLMKLGKKSISDKKNMLKTMIKRYVLNILAHFTII